MYSTFVTRRALSIRPTRNCLFECRSIGPTASSALKWGSKSMPHTRPFSTTVSQHFPRIPRSQSGQRHVEQVEEGSDEDLQIKAQEALEQAARPIHVLDALAEEADNIAYETCIIVILDRLKPIIQYHAYHDSLEFLDGFAFPKSAKGRAREATVWLFVSAYDWFTRAISIAADTNRTLSPELMEAAELWAEGAQIVEAYVQAKTSETPQWTKVGAAILNCCLDSWPALHAEVDKEDSHDKPSEGVEREDFATTEPKSVAADPPAHTEDQPQNNNLELASTPLANVEDTRKAPQEANQVKP